MAGKDERQDKPEKKQGPPPKTLDPILADKVDYAEKVRRKTIINIKKDAL